MDIQSNCKVRSYLFLLDSLSLILEPFHLFTFSLLFTNLDMERQGSHNGSGSSQNGPAGENVDMMRILQGIMETQQKQTELLR